MTNELLGLLRNKQPKNVDWSGWDGSLDGAEVILGFRATYIQLLELTDTKALLLMRDYSQGSQGVACIVTRDDVTPSLGTTVVFSTSIPDWARGVLVRETPDEWVFLVVYDSSSSLIARAITVSKSDFSIDIKTQYSSFQDPNSRNHQYYYGSLLTEGKAIFTSRSSATINEVRYTPMAFVVEVDTDYVVTFGTVLQLVSDRGVDAIVSFATAANKAVVVFAEDTADSRAEAAVLTVSGTDISMGSIVEVVDVNIHASKVYMDAIRLKGNLGVLAYKRKENPDSSMLYARILEESDGEIITHPAIRIFSQYTYRAEIAKINDTNLMFAHEYNAIQWFVPVTVGSDKTLTPHTQKIRLSYRDSSQRQKDVVRMGQNHVLACTSPTNPDPSQFIMRVLKA